MPSSRFYVIPLVVLGLISFVMLSFGLYNLQRPFEPMSEIQTVLVLNRVPGLEGPAAYLGDLVNTTGTRCVVSDKPVAISGEADIVSLDTTQPQRLWFLSGGTNILDPGCITRTYANRLPAGLDPGPYRIQGYATTKSTGLSGQVQVVTWKTESFRLVLR